MRRAPTRPRLWSVVAAMVAAILTIGVTATSSWALNGSSYTIVKNTDRNQFCLDIDTNHPLEGARAQLWKCTKGPEQKFIRGPYGGPTPGYSTIRVQNGGGHYCLTASGVNAGDQVITTRCFEGSDFTQAQAWDDSGPGTIVNLLTHMCLDTSPHDRQASKVVLMPCDNSISQHWFT